MVAHPPVRFAIYFQQFPKNILEDSYLHMLSICLAVWPLTTSHINVYVYM